MVSKEFTCGNVPIAAIGMNDVTKECISFDTFARFDQECSVPRFGLVQGGQRESHMDRFLHDSEIIEKMQGVDEWSRHKIYRFREAIQLLIRFHAHNEPMWYPYPVVDYDADENIMIGNLENGDKIEKTTLIALLRAAGLKAGKDFSIRPDETYQARNSEIRGGSVRTQMIVINKRTLINHPEYGDAFLACAKAETEQSQSTILRRF